MDCIVNKLTEIEETASSIVEHAEAQKEVLDKEYDEKRRAFDAQLEAKTQDQIDKIRSELEKNTHRLLDSQSGASSSAIELLQKEYEEKHTLYAQEIVKKVTEV
ncbi:hypothetical protein OCV51_00480 [Faecalicatena acetigenes]|uniref:ATPase n=1 Tax=Faecalicatena acetigenes TaxID=2981790 RepID=A0ABT2T7A6_9FIRM|nr:MULTISPECIES: hypothetical protein [Lachnospiraceae]MCU6746148.1 hypothetical protein [Faecalicatena acetigenes]SCG98026.1 Uncharacterised protein [uncultured Clostridium sp.]